MTKLTIAQAAAILGVPVRTVQGRIRRGQLAAERVGPARRGILLLEAADVEAERNKVYRVGRPPKEKSEVETFTFEDGCEVTVGSDIVSIKSGEFHTNSNVDFYFSDEGGHCSGGAEVADVYHNTFCPHYAK